MAKPASITVACAVLAALAFAETTESCTIVDKRAARLGTEQGIQGHCANNGETITCTLESDGGGIDCSGPSGDFSGDNMAVLVRSACGCDDPRQDPQNLKRQLETYP